MLFEQLVTTKQLEGTLIVVKKNTPIFLIDCNYDGEMYIMDDIRKIADQISDWGVDSYDDFPLLESCGVYSFHFAEA
jgi:hypothetical protein